MSDRPKPESLEALTRAALARLVGARLDAVGRAGLAWFSFTRDDVRYALHIMCPYRLVEGGNVLIGGADRWMAAVDPTGTPDDYDLEPIGATLFDVRAKELSARCAKERITVLAIEADDAGGLTLRLDQGLVLSVLPCASVRREEWRFFEHKRDTPHFVVFDDVRLPSPVH